MARIPAQCPNPDCQAIFPTPFNLTGGVLTMHNNFIDCPYCGTKSPIVDGVMTVAKDALLVLSGSNITREIVRSFQKLADQVAEGSISRDDAVELAREIEPSLGSLVERTRAYGLPGFALLVMLIQLYIGHMDSEGAHRDAVRQEATSERILDELSRMTYAPRAAEASVPLRLPGLGGTPYRPMTRR
jgi:hypothetical protein